MVDYVTNELNLNSLNLTQEQILDTENGASETSSGASYRMEEEVQNDFMFAELRAEELKRKNDQKYRHTEEEHFLRKAHLSFLSKITIYWLGLITVVSWLQGFKGPFFISISFKSEYISKLPFSFDIQTFELTNPAFIALITTTTATILGLYTIAAIWLYKGSHETKQPITEKSENKDDSTEDKK